jgi:hypothetical protein
MIWAEVSTWALLAGPLTTMTLKLKLKLARTMRMRPMPPRSVIVVGEVVGDSFGVWPSSKRNLFHGLVFSHSQ